MIKHTCFDLDGTLVDSYSTIYKTTLHTLKHLGINDVFEEKEFYNRIGHHFFDIFIDLKVNVPDIEHFINVYKSFYFDFMNDSILYPGVKELLNFLLEKDIKISLLTTKAQDQAEKIIEHFNLQKYFSLIMGRRIGMEIKPSPVPLQHICKELNISTSDSIMIGDSELDIRCGKAAGASTCATTFGYRSLEVLKAENPDYIISNLAELISVVS